MCGIAGAFGQLGDDAGDRVAKLADAMRHRGPDGTSIARGEWWVLAQNRLAIVDLTPDGTQPFTTAGDTIRCIYNGEIYNHRRLRDSFGLQTQKACDGAIIPELWARYQEKSMDLLRGMFAIAVVNESRKQLTLATDHFGIKPCYWARRDGVVYFASECRALATVLEKHDISESAAASFLLSGSVPAQASAYDNIHRVAPGTWVTFSLDGGESAGTLADVEVELGAQQSELLPAFESTVAAHLMSDVPIGLLLSDGVDSTAIALAAAARGAKLHCITVDMGGARSAAKAASVVAKRCRADHEVVRIDPSSQDIERYFSAMDRPTVDGLNTFLACQAVASRGLKVALSGAGADEIVGGGYAHHRRSWAAEISPAPLNRASIAFATHGPTSRILPARAAGSFAAVGWPTSAEQLVSFARTIRHDRNTVLKILQSHPVERFGRGNHSHSSMGGTRPRLLRAEADQYLSSQLLPDSDCFSMAHSVELRVPFADTDFARIAWGLPRRRSQKRALATAFGDDLLMEAATRKKEGFGVPMDRWMRAGPLREYVAAANRRDSPVAQFVGYEMVTAAIKNWREGASTWSVAWTMAALNRWLQTA